MKSIFSFRVLIVGTCFLLFFKHGNAQAYLKVGLTVSNVIQIPKSISTKNNIRPLLGLGFDLPISKNNEDLNLKMELCYTLKGYIQDLGEENHTYTFHYFSIPIFLSYNINEWIGADFGLQYGTLLGVHGSINDKLYNRADLGVFVGGTLFRNKGTQLGIRYTQGFLNVLNEPFVGTYGELSNTKLRNSTVQLAAHFNF